MNDREGEKEKGDNITLRPHVHRMASETPAKRISTYVARRVPTLDVRPVDLLGMRRPFVLSIVL